MKDYRQNHVDLDVDCLSIEYRSDLGYNIMTLLVIYDIFFNKEEHYMEK